MEIPAHFKCLIKLGNLYRLCYVPKYNYNQSNNFLNLFLIAYLHVKK